MKPAGLAAFKARDVARTHRYSCEREHAAPDAAMLRALRAYRKAFAFFDAQPPGYKNLVTSWIMNAKRDDTRARRLAHLLERTRAGLRVDFLNPGRR
jgi:uncharacterized protein YdeI (YjbR/CyaY-like superfamily)